MEKKLSYANCHLQLNDIARTERKKAVQAGIDYKKAVDDYNVMRKQWEDDMNLACLDFQEAEEERLQELQTILNSYLDIAKKLRDQIHAVSKQKNDYDWGGALNHMNSPSSILRWYALVCRQSQPRSTSTSLSSPRARAPASPRS